MSMTVTRLVTSKNIKIFIVYFLSFIHVFLLLL